MKDILPYVAQLLKGVAQVELAYTGISAVLPLIVLTETDNSASIIADHKEWASAITVQVDCYADSEKRVKDVAIAASDILTEHGFRRATGQLLREDDLDRYMMLFDCVVDAVNRVSSGNNTL